MVLETQNQPETKSTQKMLPDDHPDRIQIAFDDHRLVSNAGLILPATLAQHLGLRELVDNHVDLGNAPGRANPGDKMMTLVASPLAGGDCIDDADVLRTGGTARTLGGTVKAPSTLGTFLRSFRWGHVRQLEAISGHQRIEMTKIDVHLAGQDVEADHALHSPARVMGLLEIGKIGARLR